MIVVALHGFFGTPDDWSASFDKISDGVELDIVSPDLAVWATRSGVIDFETFAASFNRSVRLLAEKNQQPVVIAGYSLGARLAAHCVLDEPDLYQAALLISMNPGLPQNDLEARRQRVAFDNQWSDRMRREPWANTWTAWNEQSVLKPGSRGLLRSGQTADEWAEAQAELSRRLEGRREAWARAMEIWSLGHQQDLRTELLEWTSEGHRLTLMTGTDDTKFTELTTAWLASPAAGGIGHDDGAVNPETVRHRLVLGAGHRILNESPEDVASEITALFNPT